MKVFRIKIPTSIYDLPAVAELSEKYLEALDEKARLAGKAQDAREERDEAQKELNTLRAERIAFQAKITKIGLNALNDHKRAERAESAMRDETARADRLLEERETARQGLVAEVDRYAALEMKYGELEKKHTDTVEVLAVVQNHRDELRGQVVTARRSADNTRTELVAQLNTLRDMHNRAMSESDAEIKDLRAKLTDREIDVARAENRLAASIRLRNGLDERLVVAVSQRDAARDIIRTLVKRFSTAIALAQNFLTTTEGHLVAAPDDAEIIPETTQNESENTHE